jgi:hypothetical protein
VTKYQLDDGAWTTYAAPFIVSEDGIHTLSFYSVDRNGNTEQTKQSTFGIEQHLHITVTLSGGRGVSVTMKNEGLLPHYTIPWGITLDGGILLLGRSKTGMIPGLLPGENKTISSSVFGLGRVTITATIGDVQGTLKGFVFLIFIRGA